MPPPPGTPTSPKGVPRAPFSFLYGTAAAAGSKAASASRQDARAPPPPPRRASDGDVIMSNTSEPPTTTTPATAPLEAAAAAGEPPIPILLTLAPAIFVPVDKIIPSEESLQRSLALAETDRAEHMRQAMSRCDRHAAAVRGNLLALFRRENARLMQVAIADEAAQEPVPGLRDDREGSGNGWSASPADLERMLANMAAPAPAPPPPPPARPQIVQILQQGSGKGVRRDAGDVIGDVPEPSFAHRPAVSPRAVAAREALVLVREATKQLRAYDAHIAVKRDARRRALDKESALRRTVPRDAE